MRGPLLALLVVACGSPADRDGAHAPDAGPPWNERGCGECHEDQRAQWERSAHARAWTDPHFAAEWARRRDPFCVRCHAPLARDPFAEPAAAARGVGCEACHLRGDAVVRAARVGGEAPHPSRIDPDLSTVRACARCHQVDFPERPGLPLQNTVAEWEAAGRPGGACQTCHFPGLDGAARHDLPGGRDPELLAHALEVEIATRRDGSDTVARLTLRATGAGHAVPTGDFFRRLVVRAWPEGREADAQSVELGRHLGQHRWHEVRDDRVPAPGGGDRVVELRLFGRGRPVRWTVALASGSAHDVRGLDGVDLRPHVFLRGVADPAR